MKFLSELNKENFRALFRATFALLVSLWTGAYLWCVTFSKEGEVSKYAEFIIGFVLGTLIATLINFYFGGSENETTNNNITDGPVVSTPDTDSLSKEREVISGDES